MAEARTAVAAAGILALAGLAVTRTVLARRVIRRPRPAAPTATLADVTVLVAVRSGDPLLPERLAEQADALAPAQVRLLVDDDDRAGRSAALAAARGRDHVTVLDHPPPPPGTNPKLHKLALAEPDCRDVVVVLDDDTVLPDGGLARLVGGLGSADLVTGIPVYLDRGTLPSRMVAAFVNSSALPSYLALAAVAAPVSINGMVLATRRRDLAAIGGLGTLLDATCDDYALALAYRRHGLRIAQLAQPVLLATTVEGTRGYARLLHRWMLFAQQVVQRDLTPGLVGLVVVPAVLPLVVVAAAVASGPVATGAAVAVLVGQSVATRGLRRDLGVGPDGTRGLGLEVLALLLAPLHATAAFVGPRHVRWRGRRVRVGVGSAADGGGHRP
ncbi:glycosyltransferase [Serinibacter arcticus]|uniref:Ceramide glucosyltransferase n=1 Tax=Serinibacter arcticus TaxID=1655435 RepID=A0A4Z1E4Y5_9MICO|nr:glycosyltransferase [Serinibacter arcticus]TGO04797.1 Ceramide glucosyltransferase [Serinibacter arcticus]